MLDDEPLRTESLSEEQPMPSTQSDGASLPFVSRYGRRPLPTIVSRYGRRPVPSLDALSLSLALLPLALLLPSPDALALLSDALLPLALLLPSPDALALPLLPLPLLPLPGKAVQCTPPASTA